MASNKVDIVKDIIENRFKIPRSLDLYKEFLGKTQIEIYKEENQVIKKLIRGDTKKKIIEDLKTRYPDGRFSYDDMDKFIERNDEIHKLLKIDKTSLSKRWLKAKAECMEELAQLAFYTKSLIPKLQEEGDNNNTMKAISEFRKTLMDFMQLEGHIMPGNQVNTQINIEGDRLSTLRQGLRNRAHKADFVIKQEDDDKVSTRPKAEPENEKTDSTEV